MNFKLLIFLIFSICFSFTTFAKTKPKLKSVFIEYVKESIIFDIYTYPAKVIPVIQTTVLSESDGVVSKLHFRLGQKVQKGQVIAKIKRTDSTYQFRPFMVTSPINGVVSEVHQNIGSMVIGGSKLITLINLNKKRIQLEVTMDDLKYLKIGEKALFKIKSLEQEAIINAISPVVDPITSTARVELEFTDIKKSFPVGSLGKIIFKINHHVGLLLPKAVLSYREQKPFVRVVDSKNKTIKKISISKIRRQGGMIEITKGIKVEDMVVLRSSGYTKEGSTVKIQNPIKGKLKGQKL